MERNVVLPAPLGPSSPNMPQSRLIETPFRASNPSAYVLAIPSNSIIETKLPLRTASGRHVPKLLADLLSDSVLRLQYSLRVGGGKRCRGRPEKRAGNQGSGAPSEPYGLYSDHGQGISEAP